MVSRTVVITGPGGIGKSPLDGLFNDEVLRVDPYRLRLDGPRGKTDKLYAPQMLHDDLKNVLEKLGDQAQPIPNGQETIEWYARSKVLFFTVRGVWQCLFLGREQLATARLVKAEIYAPVLVSLLQSCSDFKGVLGKAEVIVLNPMAQSLTKMEEPWKELKEATRRNCEMRGDSDDSIAKRVKSIDAEAPAWTDLINNNEATECVGWPFAEYCYPKEDTYKAARGALLLQARERLLLCNPSLEEFFSGQ